MTRSLVASGRWSFMTGTLFLETIRAGDCGRPRRVVAQNRFYCSAWMVVQCVDCYLVHHARGHSRLGKSCWIDFFICITIKACLMNGTPVALKPRKLGSKDISFRDSVSDIHINNFFKYSCIVCRFSFCSIFCPIILSSNLLRGVCLKLVWNFSMFVSMRLPVCWIVTGLFLM